MQSTTGISGSLLLIALCLLMTGCHGGQEPLEETIAISEAEDSAGSEVEDFAIREAEETPQLEIAEIADKIGSADCIPVEPEQVQENIMGYTLMRTTEGIYYVRDSDYILEKALIGKGVFVSEHVSEMEIFVGRLLVNVIKGRGVIPEEEQQYFSEWAMEQIQKTDWKVLNTEWESEPYLYDRSYTMNYLFGGAGYDFTYSFYPNRSKLGGRSSASSYGEGLDR